MPAKAGSLAFCCCGENAQRSSALVATENRPNWALHFCEPAERIAPSGMRIVTTYPVRVDCPTAVHSGEYALFSLDV